MMKKKQMKAKTKKVMEKHIELVSYVNKGGSLVTEFHCKHSGNELGYLRFSNYEENYDIVDGDELSLCYDNNTGAPVLNAVHGTIAVYPPLSVRKHKEVVPKQYARVIWEQMQSLGFDGATVEGTEYAS